MGIIFSLRLIILKKASLLDLYCGYEIRKINMEEKY